MSRRDPPVAPRQMLEHAREAIALMAGRSRSDLDADRVLALAVVRLLEIVGEAATRVPPSVRAQAPDIPWSEAVALRNRLIHGYDVVDYDTVWLVLTRDLPSLLSPLASLLADLEAAP